MKIYCIIVCYQPNLNSLMTLCQAILESDAKVILVDNSENCYILKIAELNGIELMHLEGNQGIAKAQNVGIKLALESHADVIVFFDQDSEISNDFLSKLTASLKVDEPKVVSPVFYDKALDFKFPNYKLNRFGLTKKIVAANENNLINVDVIISSGSAATKKTFEIVGLMDEDFFIDFVDTEWALRCKAKGIPILVVPNAVMKHTIGEKSINLLIIRMFVHSPVRTYYKVRNSFIFIRKKDVPILFGTKEIISALLLNFFMIIAVENKWNYLKNYFQGIMDGIFGRVGKKL